MRSNRSGTMLADDGGALAARGTPLAIGGVGSAGGAGESRDLPILHIIWRRQTTVWLTALACVVLALFYLVVATPVFTATSRLYIEQNGPKVLATDNQGLVSQSDSYLYTQCELLKSTPILTAALETPAAQRMRMLANVDDNNTLLFLKNKLDVSVGKKDEIISVALDSPYPQEAAQLVNSIVDAYVSFESTQKRSTASEVLKILQKEKDKRDQELEDQTKALVAFKQANGEMFFDTDKGTNIIMQDLARISDELTKAKLITRSAQAIYATSNNKTATYATLLDAKQQEEEFAKLFDEQKAKALEINSKQAEFQKIQDDVDRTQKIEDLLDTRIKELSVTEDTGAMNINVLESAKAETKPTKPRKTLTMAMALVLGLMLGCGMAYMHDWVDQRIRSAEEVTDLLGLPVLGVVPSMPETADPQSRDPGRVVHADPAGNIAEAYRTLRTAVYFGLPESAPGSGAKTLLFTSPQPGDGKSTSASNLAIAMAQSGQRTLLIDADLRKPVQHRTFRVSNDLGLSNVISQRVPIERAVQRTEIEGLDVLPCGTLPPNPAEILNSQGFLDLLELVGQRYDQVLIDSPPVNPVTDARILGALCDVTILVLRAEKSTRKGSEHACESLLNVGARIFGAVVNDVPRGRRGYGYYGNGYEQYYTYSYGEPRPRAGAKSNGQPTSLPANGNGAPKALAYSRIEE